MNRSIRRGQAEHVCLYTHIWIYHLHRNTLSRLMYMHGEECAGKNNLDAGNVGGGDAAPLRVTTSKDSTKERRW